MARRVGIGVTALDRARRPAARRAGLRFCYEAGR